MYGLSCLMCGFAEICPISCTIDIKVGLISLQASEDLTWTQICEKRKCLNSVAFFSPPSFGKLLPSVDWTSRKTTWESRKSSTRFSDSYTRIKCGEFRLSCRRMLCLFDFKAGSSGKAAQRFSHMRSILVGNSESRICLWVSAFFKENGS